jgi:RNA polymerase sigma-70 factor (ECF subfamily)
MRGEAGATVSTMTLGWKAPTPWTLSMPGDSAGLTPVNRAALEEADDRALIAAFVGGTREAFDVIVERHQRNVYQLCYRFVGNHEDASDLAQDVFVRAFKGLRNFKGDSSLGTWLYRVGVNACLNRVAVKKPQTEPVDELQRADERIEDPLERLMRGERAVTVRAAIEQLPPKQRATLVLRVYHELPHEEIAGILGSSVGAVKANFFHALGNLKKLLAHS